MRAESAPPSTRPRTAPDLRLLSVQLVAPDDWLCSPVDSAADLDSIPAHAPRGSPGAKALKRTDGMSAGTGTLLKWLFFVPQVHVRYEVEALFLEGVAEACGCISNSRAVQQVRQGQSRRGESFGSL